MANPPIILVTGANKGIGYEICRQLVAKGARVFLGARDPERGRAAVDQLKAGGGASGTVELLALDVASPTSMAHAVDELRDQGVKLDALINNAGILDESDRTILETDLDLLRRTLMTNTFGPLHLTQRLAPLLADGARVINLSSGLGQLSDMENSYPAYSISKTALNAVTRQLAAALKDRNITVNSVCPGWVQTDMGGVGATRTVEQGADTPVWLATEAPGDLTGQFLRDRKPIDW